MSSHGFQNQGLLQVPQARAALTLPFLSLQPPPMYKTRCCRCAQKRNSAEWSQVSDMGERERIPSRCLAWARMILSWYVPVSSRNFLGPRQISSFWLPAWH